MRTRLLGCAVAAAMLLAHAAAAQDTRVELGVQVASAQSGQFDAADAGIGGRIGWRPFPIVGLEVQEAPNPFPCILIYPPPLACALASGRTLFALDAGGGVEVALTSRTFVRIDLGDRLVRYPGPVFEMDPRRIHRDAFFGHDFRLATGAGLRF